jgi:hypothetical protein
VTQALLPAATIPVEAPGVARLAAVPAGEWVARSEAAQVAPPAVALAVVETLAEAAVSP